MSALTVTCPFFVNLGKIKKGENKAAINCENLQDNIGFDMYYSLVFTCKEERKSYVDLFCCDNYKSCPYFRALMATKYKNC